MASVVISIGNDREQALDRSQCIFSGIDEFHVIVSVLSADFIHSAGKHQMGLVDQCDIVTQFLDRLHIVGGEDDGRPLLFQLQNFFPDELCIDRIKTGKRLVQYHQRRLVHDSGDELDLLRHTLGEFLHLLLPPVLDAEFHEPFLQFRAGILLAHSLELGQIHGLVADFHLTVKPTLLWKIADLLHITLSDRAAVEQNLAGIRYGDSVYNSDHSGLARSVRTEKAIDLAFRDIEADIVQCHFRPEVLADVLTFN